MNRNEAAFDELVANWLVEQVGLVVRRGQHQTGPAPEERAFYVRMNSRTHSIDNEAEVEKYIAGRWGKTGSS